MTTASTPQELTEARIHIAQLQVQVRHLTDSVDDLRESNRSQNEKLDKIVETLSEARGGWKTLMMVGGAAATCGAGLAAFLEHLFKG